MQFFLKFYMTLFFACSFLSVEAADFHVILVGDALSTDIFHATKSDIKKIRNEVRTIAKGGKYKLKLTVFYKKKPMAADVLQAIKDLQPNENDLVLFYFSGHGYRTPANGDDPWPNLDFPFENKGICLKGIIDLIKEKNAGLSLILADCCNWKISQQGSPLILKGPGSEPGVISARQKRINYRSLFCGTHGVIAIASARAGKPSYCTIQGSFYTNAFLASLQEVITYDKSQVNWSLVFDGAQEKMKAILDRYQLEQSAVVFTNIQ